MTFEKKLQRAHRELAGAGIPDLNYNPPLTRMLRKIGIKVRPPHYYSFLLNAVLVSIYFILTLGVLVVGVFTLIQLLSRHGVSLTTALVKLFEIGWISCIVGILLAAYFKYDAKRHGLSKWETL